MSMTSMVGRLVASVSAEASHYYKTMDKVEKDFEKTAANMSRVGRRMSIFISAPLGIIGFKAVKAFASFDKAMVEAIAVMETTGKVSKEMRAEMEAMARSIATRSVFASNELAKTYVTLARTGAGAMNSMKQLGIIAKFAQAGMFSLDQSATLLTDSLAALGLKSADVEKRTENLAKLANALTVAASLSQGSIEQFAMALTKKAGARLRRFNIRMEEGIAVLATYADQGIKSSLAGERLNVFLRDMVRAQASAPKVWKRLGISVETTDGKIKRVWKTLRRLNDILSKQGLISQQTTLEMMRFRQRSVDATLALIDQSDSIQIYYNQIKLLQHELDRIANDQLKSFAGQMKLLSNRIRIVAELFGQALAPIVKEVTEVFVAFLEVFKMMPRWMQTATAVFTLFVAALGPAVLIAGQFVFFAGIMLRKLKKLNIAFGFSSVIGAVSNAMKGFSLNTRKVAASAVVATKSTDRLRNAILAVQAAKIASMKESGALATFQTNVMPLPATGAGDMSKFGTQVQSVSLATAVIGGSAAKPAESAIKSVEGYNKALRETGAVTKKIVGNSRLVERGLKEVATASMAASVGTSMFIGNMKGATSSLAPFSKTLKNIKYDSESLIRTFSVNTGALQKFESKGSLRGPAGTFIKAPDTSRAFTTAISQSTKLGKSLDVIATKVSKVEAAMASATFSTEARVIGGASGITTNIPKAKGFDLGKGIAASGFASKQFAATVSVVGKETAHSLAEVKAMAAGLASPTSKLVVTTSAIGNQAKVVSQAARVFSDAARSSYAMGAAYTVVAGTSDVATGSVVDMTNAIKGSTEHYRELARVVGTGAFDTNFVPLGKNLKTSTGYMKGFTEGTNEYLNRQKVAIINDAKWVKIKEKLARGGMLKRLKSFLLPVQPKVKGGLFDFASYGNARKVTGLNDEIGKVTKRLSLARMEAARLKDVIRSVGSVDRLNRSLVENSRLYTDVLRKYGVSKRPMERLALIEKQYTLANKGKEIRRDLLTSTRATRDLKSIENVMGSLTKESNTLKNAISGLDRGGILTRLGKTFENLKRSTVGRFRLSQGIVSGWEGVSTSIGKATGKATAFSTAILKATRTILASFSAGWANVSDVIGRTISGVGAAFTSLWKNMAIGFAQLKAMFLEFLPIMIAIAIVAGTIYAAFKFGKWLYDTVMMTKEMEKQKKLAEELGKKLSEQRERGLREDLKQVNREYKTRELRLKAINNKLKENQRAQNRLIIERDAYEAALKPSRVAEEAGYQDSYASSLDAIKKFLGLKVKLRQKIPKGGLQLQTKEALAAFERAKTEMKDAGAAYIQDTVLPDLNREIGSGKKEKSTLFDAKKELEGGGITATDLGKMLGAQTIQKLRREFELSMAGAKGFSRELVKLSQDMADLKDEAHPVTDADILKIRQLREAALFRAKGQALSDELSKLRSELELLNPDLTDLDKELLKNNRIVQAQVDTYKGYEKALAGIGGRATSYINKLGEDKGPLGGIFQSFGQQLGQTSNMDPASALKVVDEQIDKIRMMEGKGFDPLKKEALSRLEAYRAALWEIVKAKDKIKKIGDVLRDTTIAKAFAKGQEALDGFNKKLKEMSAPKVSSDIANIRGEIERLQELLAKGGITDAQETMLKGLIHQLQRTGRAIREQEKALEKKAEAEKKKQDLESQAKAIKESIKTPFEKFNESVQRLLDMSKAGLLKPKELAKAYQQVKASFKSDLEQQNKDNSASQMKYLAEVSKAREEFQTKIKSVQTGLEEKKALKALAPVQEEKKKAQAEYQKKVDAYKASIYNSDKAFEKLKESRDKDNSASQMKYLAKVSSKAREEFQTKRIKSGVDPNKVINKDFGSVMRNAREVFVKEKEKIKDEFVKKADANTDAAKVVNNIMKEATKEFQTKMKSIQDKADKNKPKKMLFKDVKKARQLAAIEYRKKVKDAALVAEAKKPDSGKIQFAGAAEAGTVGAYSAIVNAMGNRKDLQAKAFDIQKKQLEFAKISAESDKAVAEKIGAPVSSLL